MTNQSFPMAMKLGPFVRGMKVGLWQLRRIAGYTRLDHTRNAKRFRTPKL